MISLGGRMDEQRTFSIFALPPRDGRVTDADLLMSTRSIFVIKGNATLWGYESPTSLLKSIHDDRAQPEVLSFTITRYRIL